MQIVRDLASLSAPLGPLVATIGNFDGVHRGHQWIIRNVRERAAALSTSTGRPVRSAVITFDPHPARALRPDAPHTAITLLEQKLALLAATGLDLAVVLPFTDDLRRTSARAFAEQILRDKLGVIELHEGETFRLGHNAEADIQALSALGAELGFAVVGYTPQRGLADRISSSRIRALLAAGDVSAARRLLGRPFSVTSTPASGRGYGTRYTVPTINLAAYPELLPGNGVYITSLRIGTGTGTAAERFDAVTNVGNRPTFGADSFTVESHLLHFHPIQLSESTPLELCFLHRLRDEQRFPTPQDLRTQILKDVKTAERYLRLLHHLTPSP